MTQRHSKVAIIDIISFETMLWISYKLLESSEPVSESLTPIHNQLQTVKRCLLELKRVDGLNNLKELYRSNSNWHR